MTNLEIDGKFDVPCVITFVLMCDDTGGGAWEHDHVATQFCVIHSNNLYYQTQVECGSASGTPGENGGGSIGGGSTGSSNTGPTGNGGGSSGTTPTIPTSPIPCLGCVNNEALDPCISLKELYNVNKANITPSITNYLQPKLTLPGENGLSLVKTTIGYSNPPLTQTSGLFIKTPAGPGYYGSIHLHPFPGGVPMFSWEDVFSLQQFYQECTTGDETEVVIILVCRDNFGVNQTYALKIDDINILINSIVSELQTAPGANTDLNNDGAIDQKDWISAVEMQLTLEYSQNSNKEIVFLNHFNNYGISLYKADNNLTTWSKLTISNPNTANPTLNQPIPCN